MTALELAAERIEICLAMQEAAARCAVMAEYHGKLGDIANAAWWQQEAKSDAACARERLMQIIHQKGQS